MQSIICLVATKSVAITLVTRILNYGWFVGLYIGFDIIMRS